MTNSFIEVEHEDANHSSWVLISSLDHWSNMRSKSHLVAFEFRSKTDRIEFPAEVAQLVEQWSEEPRSTSLPKFPNKLAPDTRFQGFESNSLAAT